MVLTEFFRSRINERKVVARDRLIMWTSAFRERMIIHEQKILALKGGQMIKEIGN